MGLRAVGAFVDNKCFLFPKSRMYAGLCITGWFQHGLNVSGTLVDTLQPVNSDGLPRAEFMVNSFNFALSLYCAPTTVTPPQS